MTPMQPIQSDSPRIPAHVLIMEDDLGVAEGLELILKEEGYTVDLAETGQMALEAFEKGRFDLLVADIRLPDIDGREVIRRIKGTAPTTKVIAISGYATASMAVETMKLGAHDFLPKPFSDEQIKVAVGDALKSRFVKPVAPAVGKAESEAEKLIQKREVMQVLDRTAGDRHFWIELMQDGSVALDQYRLSTEAKAAIASGDLKWINENVGELTQKQLMFIYKRLEREAW